jgi:hypothetical protein
MRGKEISAPNKRRMDGMANCSGGYFKRPDLLLNWRILRFNWSRRNDSR